MKGGRLKWEGLLALVDKVRCRYEIFFGSLEASTSLGELDVDAKIICNWILKK
jgi:hypothetical protein